jgi:hypothetical protein
VSSLNFRDGLNLSDTSIDIYIVYVILYIYIYGYVRRRTYITEIQDSTGCLCHPTAREYISYLGASRFLVYTSVKTISFPVCSSHIRFGRMPVNSMLHTQGLAYLWQLHKYMPGSQVCYPYREVKRNGRARKRQCSSHVHFLTKLVN